MLSVTVICQNEAEKIEECLKSISFADEIIVVDSGSTDETIAICEKYTRNIFHQQWLGMNGQKAFALSKTTGDWVLNIDADERVSRELADEISDVLQNENNTIRGYYIPRQNYYLGSFMRWGSWYPDAKLRLFKKDYGHWAGVDPHDSVSVYGKTGTLKNPILHYSFLSLEEHWHTTNNLTTVAAMELMNRGNTVSWVGIFFHTISTFIKSFVLKQGFRLGTRGLIQAMMVASGVLLKYAKLWELQKGLKGNSTTRHHRQSDK